MRETFICSACGEAHPIKVQTIVDDLPLCPACLELETLVCNHCGQRIMQENNAGDERTPLCQSCYDRYYTNCVRCGNLLHLDDACYLADDPDEEEPLCHSCYSVRHSESGIQSYYYKPIPIFYGSGTRYLGVELEIDQGGERNSVAKQLISGWLFYALSFFSTCSGTVSGNVLGAHVQCGANRQKFVGIQFAAVLEYSAKLIRGQSRALGDSGLFVGPIVDDAENLISDVWLCSMLRSDSSPSSYLIFCYLYMVTFKNLIVKSKAVKKQIFFLTTMCFIAKIQIEERRQL